jgi:bifunctional DNase/RNase
VRRVEFVGLQLEPGTGAVAVVLREQDPPSRVVPIVVGSAEAVAIAAAISGEAPARPSSHDLMASLVTAAGTQVRAVEVTELRDGTFLADVVLGGAGGSARVDSRPSDALALALRVGAPILVADALLEEAGFALPEPPDEAAIAAELAAFRERIDDVGADAFATPDSGVGPADREPPSD